MRGAHARVHRAARADPPTVRIVGRDVTVTVHSLGSVEAPASSVVVRTRDGRVVGRAAVGALPPPVDLRARVTTVHVRVSVGVDLSAGTVAVETPDVREITLRNNRARF